MNVISFSQRCTKTVTSSPKGVIKFFTMTVQISILRSNRNPETENTVKARNTEEVNLDSAEGELSFARIIERDEAVLNWLRPSPKEFNISYNHGKNYEPDFVVETEDTIEVIYIACKCSRFRHLSFFYSDVLFFKP